MTLEKLQSQVRLKVLDYRRLDRLISSLEFASAFESREDKDNVIKMVEACDCEALASWLRKVIEEDIGEYSVRQLRMIASKMGVPRYSFMLRSELLSAIMGAKRGRTVEGGGASFPSSATESAQEVRQGA